MHQHLEHAAAALSVDLPSLAAAYDFSELEIQKARLSFRKRLGQNRGRPTRALSSQGSSSTSRRSHESHSWSTCCTEMTKHLTTYDGYSSWQMRSALFKYLAF